MLRVNYVDKRHVCRLIFEVYLDLRHDVRYFVGRSRVLHDLHEQLLWNWGVRKKEKRAVRMDSRRLCGSACARRRLRTDGRVLG